MEETGSGELLARDGGEQEPGETEPGEAEPLSASYLTMAKEKGDDGGNTPQHRADTAPGNEKKKRMAPH